MFGLLNRRSVLLAGLAAAVGVPYAANNPQWQARFAALQQSLAPSGGNEQQPFGGPAISPTGFSTAAADLNGTGSDPLASRATFPDGRALPELLTGPPVQDLAEVLRFDITPYWITARWSRVTTVLAEYDLEGLRVPFVSGTRLDDVAGSLTYYYDKRHQLQRIAFEGQTGDQRRFVAAAAKAFGLRQEPSLYAGMYLAKWNGQPKSALVVRHAPVVTSQSPHTRLDILMEINRPDNYYQLSLPMRAELDRGRHSSRW